MPSHESDSRLTTCCLVNGIAFLWQLATLACLASAGNAAAMFCAMFVLSIILLGFASTRSRPLSRFGFIVQVYLAILLIFHTHLPHHIDPGDNRALFIVLVLVQVGVWFHSVRFLYSGLLEFYNRGRSRFSAMVFIPTVAVLVLLFVFEITPYPTALPSYPIAWISFKLVISHVALVLLFCVGLLGKMLDEQSDKHEVAER